MELSTTLQYAGDPRQAAEAVAALEPAGLDAIWVAEADGFDSPTIMGFLAARTRHAKIGSAILNVYSRTPALIAQTAAGLDALSGGRALLGLGASGPQVVEGWHGRPYDQPLGRTRETIELCRRIWRREVVDHHGITDMPLPPEKGGRLGKPLKILLAVAYGYGQAADRIQELYLTGKKREAEAAVPDALCEQLSLCGPEGYVRERIAAYRDAGVTMLDVHPVGPRPAKLIETVKNWL
ncbi:LLM class flavin-dependent oxidoreductase [Streptomyces sirii]|uniref:LLM class flavin-dependent oxidoreductase n=1 Tax=Streptomyces sirii TaxID=3127701 RepID=UPI003D36AD62